MATTAELDPGTPDPGTPDRGRPDRGRPDPGTPDRGTPDRGSWSAAAPRIYLTGFMAAGKTAVGGALAALLGYRFIDLDRQIEARAGLSAAEIFERRGEEAFRELEHRALEGTANLRQTVIATGGGAMTFERNRALIRRLGLSVWLDPGFEIILARLDEAGRRRRPLFRDPEQARSSTRSVSTPTLERTSGSRSRPMRQPRKLLLESPGCSRERFAIPSPFRHARQLGRLRRGPAPGAPQAIRRDPGAGRSGRLRRRSQPGDRGDPEPRGGRFTSSAATTTRWFANSRTAPTSTSRP